MKRLPLRLAPEAARVIRDEVTRAGGREVSFLAEVTRSRVIVNPRAVARGNFSAVVAAARDAREGSVMIHNHPSGILEPSHADLAVAASVLDRGVGTAIVANAADRMYVVVEPPEPRTVEPLEPDELSGLLAPDGPMAAMSGYEDRQSQRRMLRFVAERFNEGGIGLVEAGTGTGKSLAYLLPAARWAVRNGERAIVSTNTINLQEQLVRKDLEIVAGILGERLKWALIKGRGNYISIRRARLAAESAASLFPDDRSKELQALAEWADHSDDGSRGDLPFVPGAEVWDEVRSDTDACLRAKCPFFQQCHYQRARRDGASADVVVVNHALFFSDLSIRIATENFTDTAVLPAYKRVVFDEAHHLEDAATSRLGAEATRIGMYRALARLDRGGKGILASVEELLAAAAADSMSAERRLKRIKGRTRPLAGSLRAAFDDLLGLVEPWIADRGDGGSLRLGRPERPDAPTVPEPAADPAISEALQNALLHLGDLQRELEALVEQLGEGEDELGPELQGRLLDLRSCGNGLGRVQRALRSCLLPEPGGPPTVRWLEVRRAGPRRVKNVAFLAAPVDLGPVLAEHLFGNVKTGVLTSATMSVGGDFTYLRRRLGLAGGAADRPPDMFGDPDGVGVAPAGIVPDHLDVAESVFDSPFDHAAQSCLIVPAGLPRAGGGTSSSAYNEATADIVHDVAEITNGGLFALFTSFAALRAVARSLRRRGAQGRWPLLVQGESDRSRLLRDFARSGSAVLLGTSSFWEGVDVPGRPLRALVIQKLPFRVPTDPITEARVEAMKSRGEHPFMSFMVPDAAMRLKQGAGRLIRTRADRGAVLLLDDRLLTMRYGRVIRSALPPMPLVRGPWEAVRERMAEFYARTPPDKGAQDAAAP